MKILALDTATENCSASLWLDGTVLHREVEAERGHAELILSMVDELLRESAMRLHDVDAIAFGRGPGSFTGVRLAASVTQGLAFGAGIPVVPISDLRAVAQRGTTERVLVCNDARMQEVYWACFERDAHGLMQPVGPERVSKPSEVQLPQQWSIATHAATLGAADAAATVPAALGASAISAMGRGFAAYPLLRERLTDQLTQIDATVLPRSREIAILATAELQAGGAVAPEAAVPVYIRDDVAKPKAP